MSVQDLEKLQQYRLIDVGEKILFFPVILFFALIAFGLILFVIVNIITGIFKIPITVFHKTVEEVKDEEQEFKKNIKTGKQSMKQEIFYDLKSGSWIAWIAVVPIILIVVVGMLYLMNILFNAQSII